MRRPCASAILREHDVDGRGQAEAIEVEGPQVVGDLLHFVDRVGRRLGDLVHLIERAAMIVRRLAG